MTQDNRFVLLGNNSLLIRDTKPNDSSTEYVCEVLTQGGDKPRVVHTVLVATEADEERQVRVLPAEAVEIGQGESVLLACEASPSLKTQGMAWSRQVRFIFFSSRGFEYFHAVLVLRRRGSTG